MTTVTFLTEGKRIIGFDAKGHSGYSEEGSDIVCAAEDARLINKRCCHVGTSLDSCYS